MFESPRYCSQTGSSSVQMTSRTHFDRKEVDDVMGGEEGWKNVDQGEGASREASFLPVLSYLLALDDLYFTY
jgi:hypothetical protein